MEIRRQKETEGLQGVLGGGMPGGQLLPILWREEEVISRMTK